MTQDDLLARQVAITVAATPSAVCEALRADGVRACCFEDGEAAAGDGTPAGPTFATVRDALEGIVAAAPAYRWEVVEGELVNVYPADSVIEDEAPAVHLAGKGLWAVLKEDLRLADYGITLFMELADEAGPPVSLDLEGSSLRAALNACVLSVPGVIWHVSGRPGAYFLSVTAIA